MTRKIALTGGSSGIGKAIASRYLANGDDLTILDVMPPSDMRSSAAKARYVHLDLADADSIATAAATLAADGPFDAVLNVAGVPPLDDNALVCLTINLVGTIAFTTAMMGSLSDGASVVTVASKAGAFWQQNIDQVKAALSLDMTSDIAGFIASQDMDATRAYRLSKECLIVWSAQMAASHLQKYRFNSISPAAVDTAILDNFKAAFGAIVDQNLAKVGRAGTPDEIADSCVFMASPASNWINGVDLVIDGGMGAAMLASQLNAD